MEKSSLLIRWVLSLGALLLVQPVWAKPELSPSFVGMYRKTMQIEAQLFSVASRHGVDPRLVRALVLHQSGGNDYFVSDTGQPQHHRFLLVDPEPARANTAEANLEAGVERFARLAAQLDRHDHALAAYVAGPQALASQPALPLSILHDVIQVEQYKSVLRRHEAEVRRQAEGLRLRRVQPGEDWPAVARATGVSELLLRLYNPVLAGHRLRPGMLLAAPGRPLLAVFETRGTTLSYTARVGDSTRNLARAFGVDRDRLRQDNKLWYLQPLAGGRPLSIRRLPARVAGRATSRPPASRPASGRRLTTHTVRAGETLSRLAARYGTSVRALMQVNRLRGSRILVGQNLRIPNAQAGRRVAQRPHRHTVRRGDTLSHLAARYGTSVRALMQVNRLANSRLRVGKTLRIPDPI